jgi:uncharacterized phage protein (TIGR01671 family)
MRETKFRAREIIKGKPDKWVYGDHLSRYEGTPTKLAIQHIIEHPYGRNGGRETIWKIDPDTLGEYTGLRDRNDIEARQGDIVKRAYEFTKSGKPKETIDQIIYEPNMARFRFFHDYGNGHKGYSDLYSGHKVLPWEVIGNIYESPELLAEHAA